MPKKPAASKKPATSKKAAASKKPAPAAAASHRQGKPSNPFLARNEKVTRLDGRRGGK